LGRLRFEQGRLEEALALGERAARLSLEVEAEDEAARAWLEAARWNVAFGHARDAALCFAMALQATSASELRLSATRGLVQQLLLQGETTLALDYLQDVQRSGGFSTAQAAVLQSLEGQVLLRVGATDTARGLLEEALAALLGSDLSADALIAGLALLVAGAPPAAVAPRLAGVVPPLWRRELGQLLDDVAASGQVEPEQLARLERFLHLPDKPHGI
jgi:tetratricopeptide (TPR) repeat protein